MARRMTVKHARNMLAQWELRLARTDLDAPARAEAYRMANYYRGFVADKCLRCGRRLTDPESLARGFGSECVQHVNATPAAVASAAGPTTEGVSSLGARAS